jgi:hypothetical protein
MPATVIAERLEWKHGITILRARVRELRPLFRAPDPCQRTSYQPGELVQFDLWQPDYEIPLGFGQADKLWVVTAVSGFSRFMAAHMVPTRAGHDVLEGMLRCFDQFGAVPRKVVWDGEGCIGQWRRGKQVFTEDFQGGASIQPATSTYLRVGRMSMIWWFCTSATVVAKVVCFFGPSRTNEVSSRPMALVWLSRLRSASSSALP